MGIPEFQIKSVCDGDVAFLNSSVHPSRARGAEGSNNQQIFNASLPYHKLRCLVIIFFLSSKEPHLSA